ncbi:MAG TPA: NAD+ synthase [Methylophilaceae bacterium]
MKIAITQFNFTVGDFTGNAEIILTAARESIAGGAQLLVTPELALAGYPPEDLLLRDDFYQACDFALRHIAGHQLDIALLVGHPYQTGGKRYNAASLIRNGNIEATYLKHILPNHSVFDEVRYFSQGTAPLVFKLGGVNFGVVICADVWEPEPAMQAKNAGAGVLLALNASPYHMEKQHTRHEVMRQRNAETGMASVYVNLVGGQDELIFDGASFVVNQYGQIMHQLPAFTEMLSFVELDATDSVVNIKSGTISPQLALEPSVYGALCLGVKDYIDKNRFPGVVLGLSGGIDSALTLAIAVDALGAERVRAVMMPSPYTAEISLQDAREMAMILNVDYSEIPIQTTFEGFMQALDSDFKSLPFDLAEENLQARIRGTLLMALSNKFGSLVLTTGNKSEMGVGYSTLYGDMAGGFAVLKDVPKTLVYRLADYRNELSPVIPQRIITRPPSAELRSDQTDQDSLPAYAILDAIMEMYVEYDQSPADIINAGFDIEDVRRVVTLIDRNEYKRRQAPVGVRITHRGFGKDRRYPITSGYRGDFDGDGKS